MAKPGRRKGRGVGPARAAKKDAKALLATLKLNRLTPDQIKAELGLDAEDVVALIQMSRGYVRGAQSRLAAIRERMIYTLPRPRVDIGHGGIPTSEGGEPIEFTASFSDGVPLPGLDGIPDDAKDQK